MEAFDYWAQIRTLSQAKLGAPVSEFAESALTEWKRVSRYAVRMQIQPYEPPHYPYPPEMWAYEDPERRRRRKKLLRVIVIGAGAIVIMVGTFASVAAYEMLTSNEAQMVAQAAKDQAHATALNMQTDAKCDREVSEARASGAPMPPCAARLKDQKGSTGDKAWEKAVDTALDVMVAAAD